MTIAAGAVQAGSRADTPSPGKASYFLSICDFSHRSWDDPIVFPGKPRLSHNHTFVGNVSTNAFSTLTSLRAHGTTCDPQADTAAYWAPTLLLNDKPLLPVGATIYYRRLTTAPVRPFPPGLRMVGGNSRAWRAQSVQVIYWDCSVVKATRYGPNGGLASSVPPTSGMVAFSTVPSCPATSTLQLHVNFPDCWNGKSLDSPNHKSHMAYSANGRCPQSHPVAVPALSLVYRYRPPGPGVVILSSGGQYSGHADFINAWNQHALTQLILTCLDNRPGPTQYDDKHFQTSQLYNQC